MLPLLAFTANQIEEIKVKQLPTEGVAAIVLVVSAFLLACPLPVEAQQSSAAVSPATHQKQTESKGSARAVVKFSEIVNSALKNREWTDADGKALRAEYEKLSRADKAKANNLLAASIARQVFPAEQDKPVVLPLDRF